MALFGLSFILLILVSSTLSSEAQLSSTYYDKTCPNALATIRTSIRTAVSRDPRMAASLIRLHFHDCFVQGCDASILLEDSSSITSEQNAGPNKNSVRGYSVIQDAKTQVEKVCPEVVSCADIVAVAARDASVAAAGPSWTVKLGRRDSTTASFNQAENDIPRFRDGLDVLISRFASKGLNAREMVALSGAHTIGQAQCFTFRERLYSNESDIDAGFASMRKGSCPKSGNDSVLAPLDLVTPTLFDNNYFKNLIQKKGLLESDQVLFSGGSTESIVKEYSESSSTFKDDFASAMIKMGDISPLTGSQGQIRKFCSVVN
ncbi:hem peroxidase [Dillenia turbinata]|uniref:Peroxidase n=1 Tax=Dillenia turbinata TaxID=194707 RepID=A0AAN8VKS3_9MAGN